MHIRFAAKITMFLLVVLMLMQGCGPDQQDGTRVTVRKDMSGDTKSGIADATGIEDVQDGDAPGKSGSYTQGPGDDVDQDGVPVPPDGAQDADQTGSGSYDTDPSTVDSGASDTSGSQQGRPTQSTGPPAPSGSGQGPTEKPIDSPAPVVPPLPSDVATDSFVYSKTQLVDSKQYLDGLDYDYEFAKNNLSLTTPHVRVKIANQVLQSVTKLGVIIAGHSLSDSTQTIFSETAVLPDADDFVIVTGVNFAPETVYKVRLHFFDVRSETSSTYLGVFRHDYYFATDSEDLVGKVRARIVMSSVSEYYDWQTGRYDSSKGYTNDPGYGWCYMFFGWNVRNYLLSRSPTNPRDHTFYNSGEWQKYSAYFDSPTEDITQFSSSDMVHADYFRTGSHVGMILGHDRATNKIWTIEGNYNNRVSIAQRKLGPGTSLSWIGHINAAMIRPEAVAALSAVPFAMAQ